jgi:peptide chain release factor subunit 3
MSGFNPGASSFNPGASSFNPGARGFVPGGGGPGQQPPPHQQQQQPFNPYGGYPYQAGAYPPPVEGYQGYYPYQGPPQGYGQRQFDAEPMMPPQLPQQPPRPQAPAAAAPPSRPQAPPGPAPEPKTVSLSIGRTSDGPPAAAGPSPGAVTEPKTVSLSIGGGGSKASSNAPTPVSTPPATPAPQKPAASKVEKAKAAAAPAVAATKGTKESRSGTPTPASETIVTSDKVAEEVAAVADEESMQDLYGPSEAPSECALSISHWCLCLIFIFFCVSGKAHVNVVFIGHVDAGKSTMGGNLLYLCDMVVRNLSNFVALEYSGAKSRGFRTSEQWKNTRGRPRKRGERAGT